jgi:hypothetical protein
MLKASAAGAPVWDASGGTRRDRRRLRLDVRLPAEPGVRATGLAAADLSVAKGYDGNPAAK